MKKILLRSRVAFDAASLDWLQNAGRIVHGKTFDARKTLFAGFTDLYSAVRLYHGTRVEDFASFHESGILPSNIERLNESALQIFGDGAEVVQIINDLKASGYSEHNTGKVFACLDPDECLTYNYCWAGSEYLRVVANRLGKPEKLRESGTPTLLGFDVPVDELGEEKVRSIAGKAIGSLYENWKRPGSIKAPVPFGFALLKAVPPKQIREVRRLQESPIK